MEKKQVNYQSDFDFILQFTFQGSATTFPDYDFRIQFWTNGASVYEASCIDGVAKNCKNDEGKLRIYFDSHNLAAGQLSCKMWQEIPNSDYPDGEKMVVSPTLLPIELVRGTAQLPTDAEVELASNVFIANLYEEAQKQGYQGTKEELFTSIVEMPDAVKAAQTATEQCSLATADASNVAQVGQELNEQSKEATDACKAATSECVAATEQCSTLTQSVTAEEAKRVTAEKQRASAEKVRQANEAERVSAEEARKQWYEQTKPSVEDMLKKLAKYDNRLKWNNGN